MSNNFKQKLYSTILAKLVHLYIKKYCFIQNFVFLFAKLMIKWKTNTSIGKTSDIQIVNLNQKKLI